MREVVLDRTGHMFRFTHPETYARAVADFVVDATNPEETFRAAS